METNPPQKDAADVPPASEVGLEPASDAPGDADDLAAAPAEATDEEELPEADGDTPPFLEFLDDWEKELEPGK